MDTQELLGLLIRLTDQPTVKDAATTLSTLLKEHFAKVHFAAYDLQAVRTNDSKTQQIVCIDPLDHGSFVFLDDDKDLNAAFNGVHITKTNQEDNKTKLLLPVVLNDKSISHIITLEHAYPEGNNADLLFDLMQVCANIFRNLYEKGIDPLTRILNRQSFDQVTSKLSYNAQPTRYNGTEVAFKAIAMLDIDKFKSINDNYGHAIGDETLVLFVQTIRSVLRQEDLFFRYGGEEFVILVRNSNNSEQVFRALERCRQAIQARRFPQVGEVTVSIGFAELAQNSDVTNVLSQADKALYYIKNNNRNQVKSYEWLLERGLLEAVNPIEGSADFWDE